MDIGAIEPAIVDDHTVALRLLDRPVPLPSTRALRTPHEQPHVIATITIRYAGQPDCAADQAEHITIEPAPNTHITPTELARLPWAKVFRAGRSIQQAHQLNTVAAWRVATTDTDRAARRTTVTQKTGRAPLPDSHYLAVAKRYAYLCANGEHNATHRLADEMDANRNTVASWVRRARQRGYLPPVQPERPSSP